MTDESDSQVQERANVPENATQLIIKQDGQDVIAKAVLGEQSGIALHNFGDDPKTVWKMSAMASAGEMLSKEDAIGKAIPVKWFYAHKVYLLDAKKSEYNEAIRVVLITPDKVCYQFVSDGVAQDLGTLVRLFGTEPYDPPIGLQVVAKTTASKRTILRLLPVDG